MFHVHICTTCAHIKIRLTINILPHYTNGLQSVLILTLILRANK